MTTQAALRSAEPPAPALNATDTTALEESLKRCSPATVQAAREFRRTGDPVFLDPIVLGVIERYVERRLRPKLATATDDLRLIEDLGLDSLTMMEIVLLLEDVLHVSVSNEELATLRTLGTVRRFIAAKAGKNLRLQTR